MGMMLPANGCARIVVPVGSGPGRDVDLAGGAAELGRVNSALNLELLQHVDRGQNHVGVEVHVRVADAVQRVVVRCRPGSGNGQLLVHAIAAHASALIVGAESSGNVGTETDQLKEVSPVQWQVGYPLLLDDGADRGVV